MAMLAEPRRKQKWTLNPRGKHWSEDSNKFGQKMLEKMGWTSGKGLGANEQGMTDHIRVSYKDDSAGIGFKKDDLDKAWTDNHDGFNDFLQQLQKCQDSVAPEPTEVKTEALSGKSLELKSKQSRARVHYQKFTRGKDVNRYSSKDLANIFGQKELNASSSIKEEPKQENSVAPVGTQENRGGVITINSGSMADYFKNKGHDFSKFSKNDRNDQAGDSECEVLYAGFGFSGTPKKETEVHEKIQTPMSYAFANPCLRVNSPEDTPTNSVKVTKKRKNLDCDNNDSTLANRPKKMKEHGVVGDGYKQCFVNAALNLESQTNEAINGKEFEVSRAHFGVANSALDLTDETNEKKRVTFNDHVEYSTDVVKKKKGKATLDKFEVENKKLKKKKKNSENTSNPVLAGFVNEALDLEIVWEEINDNEVNERKNKKTKKRKESRASNLETIVETPEEDKPLVERTETKDPSGSTENDTAETTSRTKEMMKKKKKKSERDRVEDANDKPSSVHADAAEEIDEVNGTTHTEEVLPLEAVGSQENDQSRDKKKKKKKKNKAPSDTEVQHPAVSDGPTQQVEEVEVVADQKKSKRKKHKGSNDDVNKRSESVKEEKQVSDKENTNSDQEDTSKEKKRKKNKKSRESTEEYIDNNAAPVVETIKKEKTDEHIEDATVHTSFKKSKEGIDTSRTTRSPWNEKARMSKKLLKSLFQRNSVQHFPGSNIHEIKGYGTDV